MQASKQFSIVLPSNVVQSDQHPDNAPWDYTTELLHEIDLPPGEWEVAATRLLYNNRISNIMRTEQIGVFFYYGPQRLAVSANQYPASDPTGNALNDPIDIAHRAWLSELWATAYRNQMYYRRVTIPARHYKTLADVGKALARQIEKECASAGLSLKVTYSDNAPSGGKPRMISLEMTQVKPAGSTSTPSRVRLYLVSTMRKNSVLNLLGFKPADDSALSEATRRAYPDYAFYGNREPITDSIANTDHANDSVWTPACAVQTENPVQGTLIESRFMFVYCDLVEYTMAGDTIVQLLAQAPIETRYGDVGDTLGTTTHPMYVRVAGNKFRRIRIWLNDHCGEPLLMDDSDAFVCLTLHFRNRSVL